MKAPSKVELYLALQEAHAGLDFALALGACRCRGRFRCSSHKGADAAERMLALAPDMYRPALRRARNCR